MSKKSSKESRVGAVRIGIDPGTGVKSGAGLAIVDQKTGRIISCKTIWPKVPKKSEAWKRIRDIITQIKEELLSHDVEKIYIESFVMQGKGGETLARFVGGLISIVPDSAEFVEVSNTRVKKLIGGKGSDEKIVVANALVNHYTRQAMEIDRLIREEDFDALDALAILTAGELENG